MVGQHDAQGGPIARRSVILDRDGVLIRDVHLLTRCNQIDIIARAPDAIRRLRNSKFIVPVVSNQTVIARGIASEEDVARVHACIQRLLRESHGVEIDRFYFCPHHPKATQPNYRIDCDCRKPRPGMLLRAARELDLDLGSSYMIGDRMTDVIAGQRAGCRTILVKTGMHAAPPIETIEKLDASAKPDHICEDLDAAVDLILETVT